MSVPVAVRTTMMLVCCADLSERESGQASCSNAPGIASTMGAGKVTALEKPLNTPREGRATTWTFVCQGHGGSLKFPAVSWSLTLLYQT